MINPSSFQEAAKPKKNDDLDDLARKAKELEERSRRNRDQYTAYDTELYKREPDPVPNHYKEQVRDLLESRASVDTAKTKEEDARSGYVTDVSSATWQFSAQSFSPRSVISMNGGTKEEGLLKVRVDSAEPAPRPPPPPPPPPAALSPRTRTIRREWTENYERRIERFNSLPALPPSSPTVIHVQSEKPRPIIKRRELESREDMMGAGKELAVQRNYQRSVSNVSTKPRVIETVQRFEEHRRTEEIERKVQRREKRERRSRHEWSEQRHGGGAQSSPLSDVSSPRTIYERRRWKPEELNHAVRHAYRCVDQAYSDIRHRSSSLSRHHFNGYLPANESHWRHESSRRGQSNGFDEGGMAHARYGSMSDSLRRGELKYVPNGEVREMHFRDGRNGRMHKSYSTRDVFHEPSQFDTRSYSSWRRGSGAPSSPFVEYPPTLPRDSRSEYRPVSKSRSYADWEDRGRSSFGRRDDEMSKLEAEFRDSTLLMPAHGGAPMNSREHRTEQIPGGYETYHKENKADAGRRIGRDGRPVDFNEASTEYSFKREVDGRH